MPNIVNQLDNILHQVTRPARYTGGEWNCIIKDWDKTPIKVALAYPDLYEIGMSNMALPILYELLNRQPDVLAERVFAPWVDMAAVMRRANMPLFSLETKHALRDFDIIGFSLGYELTYTNVLNMLDLAHIPVLASARGESFPLVIAGGSGALNPEPMADFIDLFVVGDGEEVLLELIGSWRSWKSSGKESRKQDFLRQVANMRGIYVPSLYQVEYHADGKLKSITPIVPEAKPTIQRRIVSQLPPPVTKPVVPFIEVIHDRGAIEIQRGCSHGCRFCQAGVIYRPVRERSQAEIIQATGELIANCGYSEVSLVSLSTDDYPQIDELITSLSRQYPNLALSLPSLYVNSFSMELMESLPSHKKTGLTFALEAGSEQLRCSLNKNVFEEEFLKTVAIAFEKGWTGIKLYFMLGLPGETMEDVESISELVNKIYTVGKKVKGKIPQIRINLSTFVPKPHTPFQWVAQASAEELNAKHELLKQSLRHKGCKLSWQDPKVSLLEAALSRGDRRLGKVILRAWELGAIFDSWNEHFNYDNWARAFAEAGLEPDFYARRERALTELLPWSHIEVGVTMAYLKREYQRSLSGQSTPDCRVENCSACGIQRWQISCKQKAKALKDARHLRQINGDA